MEPEVKDQPRDSRRLFPKIILVLVLVLVSITTFFLINRHTRGIVGGLVSEPSDTLKNNDQLTNVLLLGIGGEGHEAPDLTDSIMVASLNHTDHSITLISLPRDIWIETKKAKINTTYHYGKERRDGGGLDLSKSSVSEVLGIPIHYALTIDFSGFTRVIDAVGGIEVNIDTAFDDYKYPIPGRENAQPESERYEHLRFEAGSTHMDGSTALKFARSRHAEGDEGTDYARAARQQKIIKSFQDKLLSSETLLNLDTLKNVVGQIKSSIDTDIGENEYGSFFKFFLLYRDANLTLQSISIDDLLISPKNRSPYDGQWVLVPKGQWQDIHTYVQDNLSK